MKKVNQYLSGLKIFPPPIEKKQGVADLIDSIFLAYNAGRLREACRLFTEKMLKENVTIGLSLAGALTPTGLGRSAIIPLIQSGFVDWIVSTGANLYHDAHFGIGENLFVGSPFLNDVVLRENGVIRIYDYTSSPGDSSIGMNIAALALEGNKLVIDPNKDVNETAAIVLNAKKTGGKSGVFICGGGSPKNFLLQTEPHIQEVLGIKEEGHDYFIQFTDARPDTGGLSGATPSEAVSWGKVRPDSLPDTVVCYLDSTIALPLLVSYALNRAKPRKQKRLLTKLPILLKNLEAEYSALKKKKGKLRKKS
ncbi:deoxyhypusine synthase family protein [bacterium]|nr:deoxyhypusine synthase family protein [bacterium]